MISKKRRAAQRGDDEDEDGQGTIEDLEAAREIKDENSDDDDVNLEVFMKKHSAKKGGKASGKGKKK